MRERQIEQTLAKSRKRRPGGIAPKFTSPGFAGMPDRLVLMPGGHIGFVEVKAPGEKPGLPALSDGGQPLALPSDAQAV